jgi:hypothetical protein
LALAVLGAACFKRRKSWISCAEAVGCGLGVPPGRAGGRNPAAVAHPLLKKTASAGAADFVSLKTTEAARPRDGFSRHIEDKVATGLSLLKETIPQEVATRQ